MKITVTGGSGFLGSHVADELSQRGHKVKVFDKKKSKWIRPDQKMYIGNILNPNSLKNVIKDADIVFHFAALGDLDKALKEPINTVKLNILATVQALELCKKYNVKRFIQASTIYANSIDGGFYRSSKKAAEDYVEEYGKIHGLNYTILRFGSLYGQRSEDNNGVKKIIKNAIFTNKLSYLGNKNSIRQYVNVLDAAKACVDIIKDKYKNKHIIITGKKKIKITALMKKLSQILNISNKIKYKNKKIIGHYTITPYTYKPKKGEKFKFKSTINFYDGLLQLINEIKESAKI